MLCYKYMSCELLQRTLKEDAVYIKASSPVEFNDPFDCVGRLDLSKGFSKEFFTIIPQGCDKLTGRPILRGPVFDFPVMCV